MAHVKGQRKRKATRLASARKSLNGQISVESIMKVKALADEVGGMANLKALVAVLSSS